MRVEGTYLRVPTNGRAWVQHEPSFGLRLGPGQNHGRSPRRHDQRSLARDFPDSSYQARGLTSAPFVHRRH